MASPGPPSEPPPEPEADAHGLQPELSFPDLSSVPGNELRKLTDTTIVSVELNGEIYAPIFRQMQIRADRYQQFHSGVIRVIRNRHHKLIQRGSDSSLKNVTEFLIRAFAYIIWKPGSEWVLADTDLEEGEAKLIYIKGKNNILDERKFDRFFPIIDPLWRQMRNLMFTRRRQGPTQRGRFSRRAETDGEDLYLADADTHSSSLPTTAYERARARATAKLDKLAAHIARMAPPAAQRMDSDHTEEAIMDLIVRLVEIRANSDPHTFEELWQTHVMRVEELDDDQGTHEAKPEKESNTASLAKTDKPNPGLAHYHDDDHRQHRASQSNEPFMTHGAPILPRSLGSQALIPPSLPSIMSVYISVSRLPTRSNFNTISHTAAASLAPAYQWPSAPVQEHNLAPFFLGACYRVDVSPSAVLEKHSAGGVARAEISTQSHLGGARDHTVADREMLDATSHLPAPQVSLSNPTRAEHSSPANPAPRSNVDDFTEEEWRVIALGWRDFQNDLRHAARMGTRVWRMKVGIITASSA
ncbi:hypothetical protein AYO20_04078 [Fonsecaea nubica]|uniref:Uncharacterized protein n=1 Tax=Fonsecaea nubica TaxID=856822 RepID=A0A178D4S4_9EURO|nr:hypothetical protein AYO20_04078 [Fonsecaea nubica]OAL36746.1 hypothetical protein AYO20_04078 [Fonsecaea nubica]